MSEDRSCSQFLVRYPSTNFERDGVPTSVPRGIHSHAVIPYPFILDHCARQWLQDYDYVKAKSRNDILRPQENSVDPNLDYHNSTMPKLLRDGMGVFTVSDSDPFTTEFDEDNDGDERLIAHRDVLQKLAEDIDLRIGQRAFVATLEENLPRESDPGQSDSERADHEALFPAKQDDCAEYSPPSRSSEQDRGMRWAEFEDVESARKMYRERLEDLLSACAGSMPFKVAGRR